MKKYGFLFGAGAEKAYGLPNGGEFALELFRRDTGEVKQEFKRMIKEVDGSTNYAGEWLPQGYETKSVAAFGRGFFQNIIAGTVEQHRNIIIEMINSFDNTATGTISNMGNEGKDVDAAFIELLNRHPRAVTLSNDILYNEAFKSGNKLFKSHYFSSLLLAYNHFTNDPFKKQLRAVLSSVIQLHLGALGTELVQDINGSPISSKSDNFDFFDDFTDILRLNIAASGVSGLDLLMEPPSAGENVQGIVLEFARRVMEKLYASVLDYKSLIDSYWHYLYCPSTDWAKFCRIAIFLLTVREYIAEKAAGADPDTPDSHYMLLKKALDGHLFETNGIATTNYCNLIETVLGREDIVFLNGSVSTLYDPYLNKIGKKEELETRDKHILLPLMFTQSGTKPMTAISMSCLYAELYRNWKEADAVVVVGFSFQPDDEHINNILRTLVYDEKKTLIVVKPKRKTREEEENSILSKLKLDPSNQLKQLKLLFVDDKGLVNNKPWTECLDSLCA